jgi:hypothetical protein
MRNLKERRIDSFRAAKESLRILMGKKLNCKRIILIGAV